MILMRRDVRRAQRILKDSTQPSHCLFTLPPSAERYRRHWHATRLQSSVPPQAVTLPILNTPPWTGCGHLCLDITGPSAFHTCQVPLPSDAACQVVPPRSPNLCCYLLIKEYLAGWTPFSPLKISFINMNGVFLWPLFFYSLLFIPSSRVYSSYECHLMHWCLFYCSTLSNYCKAHCEFWGKCFIILLLLIIIIS